jgi:hypothetical protein
MWATVAPGHKRKHLWESRGMRTSVSRCGIWIPKDWLGVSDDAPKCKTCAKAEAREAQK